MSLLPAEHTIETIDQLVHVANQLAPQLRGGMVIALSGDLGSGKTTFVNYLAQSLGATSQVTSPTFSLIRQYLLANNLILYHSDWYRLHSAIEVQAIGLTEMMGQPTTIVMVEWPERAKKILPANTIWITFTYVEGQTRHLTITT